MSLTPPLPSSPAPAASLWDHLAVEVQAAFAPSRIPLRQLKQLSEGLIVDVGPLLHSPVELVANGSVLAHGELVVMGDRFGVLITQLAHPQQGTLPPLGGATPPLWEGTQAGAHEAQHGPASSAAAAPAFGQNGPPAGLGGSGGDQPSQQQLALPPEVMALVQQTGLAPQLALAALQVGMDPAQLVGAAQQQGIPVNEFVAGVFQQQGIPLPPPEGAPFPPSSASSPDGFEGYGPNQDDDDDEASQMMDEVDDLLNDDFDQNDD